MSEPHPGEARRTARASRQEALDILGDEETLADLRQSREDFAAGDTFDAGQVRAELERVERGVDLVRADPRGGESRGRLARRERVTERGAATGPGTAR
jgi:hypothetical protein